MFRILKKDRNNKVYWKFFLEDLYRSGRETAKANKNNIRATLDNYLRPDGVIDGKKMNDDWFPSVNAHVFLSHSHADEKLAIAFSQWLWENFRIRTFIDSTVWGYADDLIWALDNKYSCNDNGKSRVYQYQPTLRTTAFVHNLLTSSLSKMMDKCECLFFLNTPNSINPDPGQSETSSPWIFHELEQSRIIRERPIERTRSFSKGGLICDSKDFRVALPARTSHLTKLSDRNLMQWMNEVRNQGKTEPHFALDILYHLT